MDITMTVRHRFGKETWEETFDPETTRCLAEAVGTSLSVTEYSQMIIDYFNDTLKPGERERVLVSARLGKATNDSSSRV